MTCRRDPDAFAPGSQLQPYHFTQAIKPDAELSSLLHKQCAAALGKEKALQGLNITADSFYSSQVYHAQYSSQWQLCTPHFTCCSSLRCTFLLLHSHVQNACTGLLQNDALAHHAAVHECHCWIASPQVHSIGHAIAVCMELWSLLHHCSSCCVAVISAHRELMHK